MSDIIKESVNFFKVLSDPTRLELLYLLKERDITQGYIQKKLGIAQSTSSQHLKTLIDSNLIEVERNGNKNHYKIKDKRFFELLDAFRAFVIKLSKEKLDGINELDVIDTLL